jgi:hypothetical protein
MRIGFAVLTAAVLTLAACGPSQSSTPAKPSSAQPTKESGLQEYQSAQQLADDLTKYGHTCVLTPTQNDFAADAGECTTDVGPLALSVYYRQDRLHEQLHLVAEVNRNKDYGWLVGTNWSIDCGSRATAEKIHAEMGGSITSPIATTPS